MTHRVTIEVNQVQGDSWVGVVRDRRDHGRVVFVSTYECTPTLAFLDCMDWIEERERSESQAEVRPAGSGVMRLVPVRA